uniref:Pept_C1 domain-containing protein n=1 Tax=Panagrellus redivivus TaxID=6233 RepID=A0A7E4UU13_PANRE
MNPTVTFILLLYVLRETVAVDVGISEQFQHHLAKYNIQMSKKEFAWRTLVFAENLRRIDELNAEHYPYTWFEVNQFSHLSFDEFLTKHTSGTNSPWGNYTGPVHVFDVDDDEPSVDGAQVDWRARGKVTGVKDQKSMGSCTIFAVNAAIEGIDGIKRNRLISVSEQQVVDCVDDYNFGNEFGYVQLNGVVHEEAYPYHSSKGNCKVPGGDRVRIDGMLVLSKNTECGIEQLVRTYGPMSVAIHVNDAFMHYRGGILSGACNDGWHAVAVVGFGRDNDQDYWIIKNSWSSGWGEGGYIRLRRKQNTCDIDHAPATAYIK